MLDAEGRKQRAKRASAKAAKLRTARAKPFIDGVVAAYLVLRTGKSSKAGAKFLLAQPRQVIYNINVDHATAINILADTTGKTKKRIRQIIQKYWIDKGNHLTGLDVSPTERSYQISIFDAEF